MKALFALLLAVSLSFACGCGTNSCGGDYKPGGTLDTLDYALELLKRDKDPDVKLALATFKKKVQSLKRGVPVKAFENGKFDKKAFIDESYLTQKIQAQVDLFETLYGILDNAEKKQLHILMAAHQHYLKMLFKENNFGCKSGANCDCGASCQCGANCKCGTNCACGNKAAGKGMKPACNMQKPVAK